MFKTIMTILNLHDVTDTDYDSCTYAAFHKALKYPTTEIDDFDVTLFPIYCTTCVSIIISSSKLLLK